MSAPSTPLGALESAQALAVGFAGAVPGEVSGSVAADDTPVVDVPREGWVSAALHARDDLGYDFFDWLSAVDMPDADPAGVDVVLHVFATGSASTTGPDAAGPGVGLRRLLLRTRVPDADNRVASLTEVWPGAAWHERETFEMFGVAFDGFTDGQGALRPLLLPDGFEGTPLRKSFVLAARASKPWPGAKEPGESESHTGPTRRKVQPPGVPDPFVWGPREAGVPWPPPQAEEEAPRRGPRAERGERPERPVRGDRPARERAAAAADAAPSDVDQAATQAPSAEPTPTEPTPTEPTPTIAEEPHPEAPSTQAAPTEPGDG